jgi:hypothetical protein
MSSHRKRVVAVVVAAVLTVALVVIGVVSVQHAQEARAADPTCTAPLGVGCTSLSLTAVEDAARMNFPEGTVLNWANYTDDTRWRLRAMVQVPAASLDEFLGSLDPAFYPAPAKADQMDATIAQMADFLTTNYGATDVSGAASVAPGVTRNYVVGKYSDGSWLVYMEDTQA